MSQTFKILLYSVLPAASVITIIIVAFLLMLCSKSKSGCTNRHGNSEESPCLYETITINHATNICYEVTGIDTIPTFNIHDNSKEDPHYETINPEIHATNVYYDTVRIDMAFNDAYVLRTKFNSLSTSTNNNNMQKPNITCI